MSDTSTTGQKVAAEAIGTFVLVFLGTSAAILTQGDLVAIALAFGLALMLGVHAFGRVSGAHLNPAVSVGAAISGRMSWRQVPVYVGAQVLGAIVASGLLWLLVQALPETVRPDGQLGQNFFGGPAGFAWWGALVVELVGTAILVLVILASTDGRNEHPGTAPLVIGLTLGAIHLAVIPLTGTSVNPARSIGPALFTGLDSIEQLWLFILAPVLGAALAGLAYPAVFGRDTDPVPGSGLAFSRPSAGSRASVPGYGAPDQFQQEWNQQEQWSNAAVSASYDDQEPIIQDGWQWDHQAQEWRPLEHWTSPDAAGAAGAGAAGGSSAVDPAQPLGGDPQGNPVVDPAAPTSGAESTRIRPE